MTQQPDQGSGGEGEVDIDIGRVSTFSMAESVLDVVRGEIERMHVSFVEWFSGTCDNDDETFHRMFESKFVAEALYILPAGAGDEVFELLL